MAANTIIVRFFFIPVLQCISLQRLCVEKGLLNPSLTRSEEDIAQLSVSELRSLHKVYHELLYFHQLAN